MKQQPARRPLPSPAPVPPPPPRSARSADPDPGTGHNATLVTADALDADARLDAELAAAGSLLDLQRFRTTTALLRTAAPPQPKFDHILTAVRARRTARKHANDALNDYDAKQRRVDDLIRDDCA